MTTYTVNDDAEWHKLRASHVGSSDVACLLGVSKRKTPWQLFMEKTARLPPLDLDDIPHIRNGKFFEPAIANIGQEKFGIKLRKVRRYIEADDCPALGVSVDYEEIGGGVLCPVEIKWSTVGIGWDWEGDTVTEAPDEYLIQVQAQLACMPRATYARLWAFVQGDVRQMIVEPRPKIITRIKQVAGDFMREVAAGDEPPVDFSLDGDAISRLAMLRPMVSVDLTKDHDTTILVRRYRKAVAIEKRIDAVKSEAAARVLKAMIDAAEANGAAVDDQKIVATLDGFTAVTATVAENPGRIVTQEDLGAVINKRAGFRRLTIKESKNGKE